MSDFADLADGGRQLGPLLQRSLGDDHAVVLAAVPNGVPVALGMGEQVAARVQALAVERSDDGAVIRPAGGLEGRTVVVVDDGVETGTVARAAADALRQAGARRLVLAVPVCPDEALADLQLRYDEVVAVVRPPVRRSLDTHYASFDTIDEAEALRRLSAAHGEGPA